MVVKPNRDNAALPYVTRARARRAEDAKQATIAARRAAGQCVDCGAPADGERCAEHAATHKVAVTNAFRGLGL